MLWLFGEGGHLEDTAVKGEKVLLDQLISGFQVVIEVDLQKGAELIIAVERESMAIGYENKKEIEQELMVGKRAPESVPEEPMFDGSEATLDGTQSMWDKRFLVDHDLAPFGLKANTQERRELSSPLMQSPSMDRNPLVRL